MLALLGVGGGNEFAVGDLIEKLDAVEGFELKLSLESFESSDRLLCRALGGGLAKIGVRALRKSVYAVGGVMGVFKSCSCFMRPEIQADTGVEQISDGKDAVFGV